VTDKKQIAAIFNYEIRPATLANAFLFILQGSALAIWGVVVDFTVHLVAVNFCYSERITKIGQYLPKLCSNEKGSSFLTHSVVIHCKPKYVSIL